MRQAALAALQAEYPGAQVIEDEEDTDWQLGDVWIEVGLLSHCNEYDAYTVVNEEERKPGFQWEPLYMFDCYYSYVRVSACTAIHTLVPRITRIYQQSCRLYSNVYFVDLGDDGNLNTTRYESYIRNPYYLYSTYERPLENYYMALYEDRYYEMHTYLRTDDKESKSAVKRYGEAPGAGIKFTDCEFLCGSHFNNFLNTISTTSSVVTRWLNKMEELNQSGA